MTFFKKIFSKKSSKEEIKDSQPETNFSLEDFFVQTYINNGGKFIYCTNTLEVKEAVKNICYEKGWLSLSLIQNDLKEFVQQKEIEIVNELNTKHPLFTNCEALIAENGSILFSSNQVKSHKLVTLHDDFIVFATTSQLVKSMDNSLTYIKTKYSNREIPTNISAIKKYSFTKNEDDFMNYGNFNAKRVFLILLEDL